MNPDLFVRYDVNFFAAFLPLTILVAMHRRRDGFNFSARLFRLLVSVNFSMLILEVLSWEFDGRPGEGLRLANYLTNWIFLWLSPLIVSVWASYIDF